MASIYNGAIGNYNAKQYKDVWRHWVTQTSASWTVPNATVGTGNLIWQDWNRYYQTTTTSNNVSFYVNGNQIGTGYVDWIWQPTQQVYLDWNEWNVKYELTKEEKLARRVHEFVQWARYGARYPGQAQIGHSPIADLDELLAEVAREIEDDLTPEQWREIGDAWQRGSEEHREDLHQAELARMHAEERERMQAEADRRAELLLLSLLTHEQKEEWLANRCVTEVAPSGRIWRLFPKWSGAACLMEGNVRRATLCLHPLDRVPDADVMAAILVGLRSGEEERYIQIAVLHHGHWTPEEERLRRGYQTRRVQQPEGYVVVPAVA